MRRMLSILLVTTLAVIVCMPVGGFAQNNSAIQAGLNWMQSNQQADGGFPGFGPGDTADAIQAIVAAGEPLDDFAQDGNTSVDFLAAQASSYAGTSVGGAAKLVLAAIAAGADPTAFGGVNLLELLGQAYDPASGQYGPDVYGHTLVMLAIRSVGANPPQDAVARLIDLQLEDGGWSFDGTGETGSDTNTTALAIQALTGQRQADGARGQAIAYLQSQQNDDGGFPYSQTSQFGNASDANSTALAIQAIRAAGQDPTARAWQRDNGGPVDLLASLQNDSGAFRYQEAAPDDNALATYQALPALLIQPLPVRINSVSGAQALVAPGAAADPAAPALPATGAGDDPTMFLAFLAGLALLSGVALRRVAR
ncbi:MAG: terpene cyclase/mutase family protein [Oscillochloris sp.]|nr:terpene cyclase/mutase family protein [Oscillochloris sp.]